MTPEQRNIIGRLVGTFDTFLWDAQREAIVAALEDIASLQKQLAESEAMALKIARRAIVSDEQWREYLGHAEDDMGKAER